MENETNDPIVIEIERALDQINAITPVLAEAELIPLRKIGDDCLRSILAKWAGKKLSDHDLDLIICVAKIIKEKAEDTAFAI